MGEVQVSSVNELRTVMGQQAIEDDGDAIYKSATLVDITNPTNPTVQEVDASGNVVRLVDNG